MASIVSFVKNFEDLISTADLMSIANDRLLDAIELDKALRHDGAAYMCGYTIELGLKCRICKTLGWTGFPSTSQEFQKYSSFKVHDLSVLLRLSGIETLVKTTYFTEWNAFSEWNPETRYNKGGRVTPTDAANMISSAKTLITLF